VLDKVAVATSDYLGIPGRRDRIHFKTRWFDGGKNGEPFRWQPMIHEEILKGNTALIALSDISWDILEGYLREKHKLRNSSTHRFTVLHDIQGGHSRQCEAILHCDTATFEDQLIETLQLARAALFYFVDMVRIRENRVTDGKPVLPLHIPDHDWVRGRDTD
jgi:hypothetical protein